VRPELPRQRLEGPRSQAQPEAERDPLAGPPLLSRPARTAQPQEAAHGAPRNDRFLLPGRSLDPAGPGPAE